MKKLYLVVIMLVGAYSLIAQTDPAMYPAEQTAAGKQHKIIFQLTTDDTLAHKSLMKQLNNITSIAPNTKIEVVCHGPGLYMLIKGKSPVQEKITALKKKDIVFMACEFSMSERNVTKDKIIPEAGFVKTGIIEIVTRQEEGWSYIKSVF